MYYSTQMQKGTKKRRILSHVLVAVYYLKSLVAVYYWISLVAVYYWISLVAVYYWIIS